MDQLDAILSVAIDLTGALSDRAGLVLAGRPPGNDGIVAGLGPKGLARRQCWARILLLIAVSVLPLSVAIASIGWPASQTARSQMSSSGAQRELMGDTRSHSRRRSRSPRQSRTLRLFHDSRRAAPR